MVSDEDRARALIGQLRTHALTNGGNYHYFQLGQLQDMLKVDKPVVLGAILFAEGQGWVRAMRDIGAGVTGASLRGPGLAEAGKSPAPPVAANVHYGDVVHGHKAETHGDKSNIKQVSKTHDGDTTVSTNLTLRAKLRKLFGLG